MVEALELHCTLPQSVLNRSAALWVPLFFRKERCLADPEAEQLRAGAWHVPKVVPGVPDLRLACIVGVGKGNARVATMPPGATLQPLSPLVVQAPIKNVDLRKRCMVLKTPFLFPNTPESLPEYLDVGIKICRVL